MDAGEYGLGMAGLLAIVGALGLAAVRLRAWATPDWSGAPARLAEAVIGLALLIGIAELLGTVGLFDPLPLVFGCMAVGAGVWVGAGPRIGLLGGGGERERADDEHRSPRRGPATTTGVWIAIAAAALVMAHWAIGTQETLAGGMVGFDSQWYHMPFAAQFAQTGEVTQLHFTAPVYLNWFYPASSELLHSVGILLFSSHDILSPGLNLAWLGLALLSAWCIGRPWGVGAASVLGVAVVLDSGLLADQAGEARNDIPVIALLLASVALLLQGAGAGIRRHGEDQVPAPKGHADRPTESPETGPGTHLIAALAAGLAVGVKLTALAPAAVLTIGTVLIAPRAQRRGVAGVWAAGLAAGGAFWYLRNIARAANPLPWLKSLGPIPLPHPDQPLGGREDHSVASYLTDTTVWNDAFFPGLHDTLGALWPVVLAAALVGVALAISSGGARRVAALAACAAALAWLFNPVSAAGPEGNPIGFESNLRYLAPGLALALALLPLAPVLREGRRPWVVVGALTVLLLIADRSAAPWTGDHVAAAALTGIALVGVPVAAALAAARGRRALAGAALAALGIATIAVGYAEQRDYVRDRYANPTEFTQGGLNDVFRWARDTEDVRIGTNVRRQYPLYGAELSNRVFSIGRAGRHGAFTQINSCTDWRRAINEGHYRYVITTVNSGLRMTPRETLWMREDPAAERVLSSPPAEVFELRGKLDPAGCPGA